MKHAHRIQNAFSRFVFAIAFAASFASPLRISAAEATASDKWPKAVQEVRYLSAGDNTEQPALFYKPETKEARPLLVGLHSWSGEYHQSSSIPYAEWCISNGWVFIHPNFRGPNNTPAAMGSELVVQDIKSAVDFAKTNASVDPRRIYLVGASGGGSATLLMAGRTPEIWTAVSAWVPITDIKAWHAESVIKKQKYAGDMEESVGGKPVDGSPAEAEALKRSAITYLGKARSFPIDINAGIHDGHTGSVPISHSLNAFNLLAKPADRLTPEQIRHLTDKSTLPDSIPPFAGKDETYGRKTVLFRRESNNVRITLFEGGHEIVPEAALQWLSKQIKSVQ